MNTRQAIAARGRSSEPKLLCAHFNQDQDCFAIGHEHGFRVYSTDPMVLRVKRTFHKNSSSSSGHRHGERDANQGQKDQSASSSVHAASANNGSHSNGSNGAKEYRSGIGHISMLHRTNYLSLVGGGKNPKFPLNKVIIYDDLKKKNTLALEFMNPVLNVFLSRIRIIVVVETHIYVYAFSSPPKKIATYETISNPHGTADLSNSLAPLTSASKGVLSDNSSSSQLSSSAQTSTQTHGLATHVNEILAFPGRHVGQIQIVDISPVGQERNLVSIIKAHKSRIRCLTLNRAGTMVASASETGTIIRVHSVVNCSLLYEFRRGLDKAIVYSMRFSPNGSKLAVLSDKQTLHVFKLSPDGARSSEYSGASSPASNASPGPSGAKNVSKPSDRNINRQHFLKSLPIFTNYFNSQWSFVSCHLDQPHVLASSSSSSNGGSSGAPLIASGTEGTVGASDSISSLGATAASSGKCTNKNSNNDKFIDDLNVNSKINDRGVLGWSNEDSIIIIWKFRGKWEKYVIIKSDLAASQNNDHGSTQTKDGSRWELVREGWRSFGDLNE